MSAISSIGGSSPLTYLQQLQQRGQGIGQAGDQDGDRAKAVSGALSALGVDPSKASTIEDQIQQAVTDAASNSSDPTARRTAVQQAVDGVLKNNGIDPAQFRSQLQAQFQKTGGRHHHHHSSGSTNQLTSNSPGQNAASIVSANSSSSGFNAVV